MSVLVGRVKPCGELIQSHETFNNKKAWANVVACANCFSLSQFLSHKTERISSLSSPHLPPLLSGPPRTELNPNGKNLYGLKQKDGKGFDMGNSRRFAKEPGSSFVVISSDTTKPEFSFLAPDVRCENCEENEGAFNVLGGF
ncbi:hypothetical protein TSUD_60580 [Trifolium subterraneum]|uniref:Uncharacterized protein n=1 Tax=Trifolium subterraneum TaxID=3900 RepID=A0A2Z6PB21_TRISU|nr:hypothetical protein TSUD_60580 [Trifolium subterraneum]